MEQGSWESNPLEYKPWENRPVVHKPPAYIPQDHLHRLPRISDGKAQSGRFGIKAIALVLAILLGMSLSGLINIDWNNGPPDADGDGVPDGVDSFPKDDSESEDADGDGTGDNEDLDDDNDGVPDTNDTFPTDANETSDNDFDGVGNNADPDDDNDGFNDTEDLDPFHDLALSFDFSWVNLTVPLNSKSSTWFQFELIQNGVRLKMFDDSGRAWRIPWQEQFNLTTSFEVNVPDNVAVHEFQVKAYQVKWFSGTLLDLSPDNTTYTGNISYDLSSNMLVLPANGILDGSLDNGTDEPDAILALNLETFHFGYLKSYSWYFEGTEYIMSYNFDPADYSYYNARNHKVNSYDDYVKFATPDDQTMIELTGALFELVSDKSFSPLQEAQYILNFVQGLKYAEDNVTTGIGEYPRYPVETLVEQMGDCEDTAILAATIAEIRGIESILLLLYEAFPEAGHAAPAFLVNSTGTYYELEGEQYFYGESTGSGWEIGELPEFDSSSAYLYAVE